MAFNLKATNKIQLCYIDAKNCDSTNIYIPQSVESCTTLGTRYGSSICGNKKRNSENEIIFYVFGGALIDNTSFDSTLMNDLHRIDVTIYGGSPMVSSVSLINIVGSIIPAKRVFANIKLIGSFLHISGGADLNWKIIPDSYKFSLITNEQIETIPSGYTDTRIFCGA